MLQMLIVLVFCSSALAQAADGVRRVLPSATVDLRDPRSISVATDGNVYVADTGHHRVLAVDAEGKLLFETGGFGSEHGQFQWPRKVIADRGTSVWVLDYGNRRIEKFSRSLEYQGTFFIPGDDESRPRQIEALAVSPQGDLYVFDRDGGRLLRYDPLFRVQAELGQDRGREFISALSRMTFVPKLGLVWWERGAAGLQVSDPLLTQVRTLSSTSDRATASTIVASRDSCLVFGTANTLESWCDLALPPDSLLSLNSVEDISLKRLDDIAFPDRRTMYVLDGLAGAVYRLSLSER